MREESRVIWVQCPGQLVAQAPHGSFSRQAGARLNSRQEGEEGGGGVGVEVEGLEREAHDRKESNRE